jgi:hypothetical protein
MAVSLFRENWYRIAQLKPRLRDSVMVIASITSLLIPHQLMERLLLMLVAVGLKRLLITTVLTMPIAL